MLNVTHTLERMEIPMSTTRAIQAVREIIEADPIREAAKFIKSVLSLDVKFEDADVARVTALAVVEAVVKVGGVVGDETELYNAAVKRAEDHMNAPRNRWMYAKEAAPETVVETREVEGLDIKVAIRADGRVKRGGKAVIAEELFKKHVLESETPCDNACFVRLLMETAGMSLAGARTYAHNLRKANGMVAK